MRKNGETNPVTYLFFALLAAAGFYAFHVGPVYWDNMAAKEAASEALNVYIMTGEDAARLGLLNRLNALSPDTMHFQVDAEGVETEQPGYGVTDDNITFKEQGKKVTVRLEYDRTIQFKPLKKRKTFHLVAEKTGTLK